MALDPDALVSVDEARVYLQVAPNDKPSTGLLEQVIGGLSRRVLQHTGHTYINPENADKASTRRYDFDPLQDRELAIDNCREIGVIEATATPTEEESWVEVDPDLVVFEPLNGPVFDRLRFLHAEALPAHGTGWGLLGLHASPASMPSSSPWPNQVRAELNARAYIRVSAKWGYGDDLASVPPNVKLAVLMWLQNIHKRDSAFFSESAKVTAKIAMPEDVRELLDGEAASEAAVSAV